MADDSMSDQYGRMIVERLDKIIRLLDEIAAHNRKVIFQTEGDR